MKRLSVKTSLGSFALAFFFLFDAVRFVCSSELIQLCFESLQHSCFASCPCLVFIWLLMNSCLCHCHTVFCLLAPFRLSYCLFSAFAFKMLDNRFFVRTNWLWLNCC